MSWVRGLKLAPFATPVSDVNLSKVHQKHRGRVMDSHSLWEVDDTQLLDTSASVFSKRKTPPFTRTSNMRKTCPLYRLCVMRTFARCIAADHFLCPFRSPIRHLAQRSTGFCRGVAGVESAERKIPTFDYTFLCWTIHIPLHQSIGVRRAT